MQGSIYHDTKIAFYWRILHLNVAISALENATFFMDVSA